MSGASGASASSPGRSSKSGPSGWKKYYDANSGRDFWHHKERNMYTEEDPCSQSPPPPPPIRTDRAPAARAERARPMADNGGNASSARPAAPAQNVEPPPIPKTHGQGTLSGAAAAAANAASRRAEVEASSDARRASQSYKEAEYNSLLAKAASGKITSMELKLLSEIKEKMESEEQEKRSRRTSAGTSGPVGSHDKPEMKALRVRVLEPISTSGDDDMVEVDEGGVPSDARLRLVNEIITSKEVDAKSTGSTLEAVLDCLAQHQEEPENEGSSLRQDDLMLCVGDFNGLSIPWSTNRTKITKSLGALIAGPKVASNQVPFYLTAQSSKEQAKLFLELNGDFSSTIRPRPPISRHVRAPVGYSKSLPRQGHSGHNRYQYFDQEIFRQQRIRDGESSSGADYRAALSEAWKDQKAELEGNESFEAGFRVWQAERQLSAASSMAPQRTVAGGKPKATGRPRKALDDEDEGEAAADFADDDDEDDDDERPLKKAKGPFEASGSRAAAGSSSAGNGNDSDGTLLCLLRCAPPAQRLSSPSLLCCASYFLCGRRLCKTSAQAAQRLHKGCRCRRCHRHRHKRCGYHQRRRRPG